MTMFSTLNVMIPVSTNCETVDRPQDQGFYKRN